MNPFPLRIDGIAVATTDHFEVINPATGELAAEAPCATLADVDAAVAAAKRALPGWRSESNGTRQRACIAIADLLDRHREELARLLTQEQGKPLYPDYGSRWEVQMASLWTRATAGLQLRAKTIQDDSNGRVDLYRDPIGVVGSITPWNFPLLIAMWHIVPAIRSGNTVVIKPASGTPLATLRMVEFIDKVLPPGVLNAVSGPGGIGPHLTTHPQVGKIILTGSTETGRKVMAAAAPTLKRLTLELGGNDAAIVLPDVDPEKIAEHLFWGAFLNAGQMCTALKRLYVHHDVHDAVCEALVAVVKKKIVGDGFDRETDIGPVQNRGQFDKICALVADARERGGRILIGGNPDPKARGYFHPITLVDRVRNGVKLVDEEQFGPALPIIRYKTIEDAIGLANDSPYGLGGSVWSNDIAQAKRVASRLECGSVWINKHGAVQPNVPFGGVKDSGIGVEFAREGLHEYTTLKAVFA